MKKSDGRSEKAMGKAVTNERRNDAKQTKRNGAETIEAMPLVSTKRGKFETIEFAKVEALAFARLEDYKAFIAEMEGEEPEAGAVISAGLEMLFDADRGFERWAAERRKKGKNCAKVSASSNRATPTAKSGTADVMIEN
ncbi:MAG: hypothetical protein H0W76_14220 [Pyrinomonadaceae bacterium]|nr:hypothetical protein [Pyrinomonadaceae bacterium]